MATSAVLLPLRLLGLDPGRSLTNAHPSARRRQADRAEQFAYIASRLVDGDQHFAVIARGTSDSPDGVSIVVFGEDDVVTRRGSLDRPLRELIAPR
jgi:hypothetical protein